MNSLLPLLAAALLLPLALPHAGAQAAPPPGGPAPPAAPDVPVHLLDDKVGDVKVNVAGTDQDAAGRWAAADLKALDVREGPDQISFILTVASLAASPEAPIAEDAAYAIAFRHNDQAFRVSLDRRILVGAAQVTGDLEAYDPARRVYHPVGPFLDASQDTAAGTLTFTVDRDLLLDREGNAPHPEVPLTDWRVTSVGHPLFGFSFGQFCLTASTCAQDATPYAHDEMPDQGNGTVPLLPRYGIAQGGHARLYSDSPTRASNGEATTIVYQVTARNLGNQNETFALSSTGVPAGWDVRLPAARVAIPARGLVLLPVLASIPFAHQHGAYLHFTVESQSVVDPASTGRIVLGVRFTNPPQPAGHHNALWLHAASAPGQTGVAPADALLNGPAGLYMNALADDPLDAHTDMPGNFCGQDAVPPRATFCWTVPLQPQLELGLDLDLTRQGTFGLPIKTTLPLPAATLGGSLQYVLPGDNTPGNGNFTFGRADRSITVATIVPHAPIDVAPNSQGTLLTADVAATPEGRYVPYHKGAALYLDIEVAATGVQAFGGALGAASTTPSIQPGGLLADLPLNEYHDPVAQVFASNATLQLLADGPQDRATNPGKTLLYNLTLQNGGAAGLFNLELTGTHLPWARIAAPGDQVRLASGASTPVRVAVQVPGDADKGDTADLVLSATSAADLNVRSLARLFATVDTSKPYPDEAGLLSQVHAKKTPGFEALLAAPALVALAALARRRRA